MLGGPLKEKLERPLYHEMTMCMLSDEALGDLLKKGRVYEVGGAVRDRFLTGQKSIKDRDYLVTGVPYDELTKTLSRHGRVDLVGKSFGVIKFTQFLRDKAHTFDIALPRKEHSTGVGHREFAVHFDPALPVEVDLERRDFTINAMAVALDNEELVDPLGGMSDLKNHFIRMTSPQSFSEDPLRMLRAVQFAARFEFEIEKTTFDAIGANAKLITTVSEERISDELTKLLVLAKKPSIGFYLMQKTGLLKHILPQLEACVGVEQPGPYHAYDVFVHTLYCIDAAPMNLRIRLAALFHDINKPQARVLNETGATFYGHEIMAAKTTKRVMERLRFSKELTREVMTLVERHMFTTDVGPKGMRRLINKVGKELIFDLLELRRADVHAQGKGGRTDDVDAFEHEIRAEIDKKAPFGLSDLALNGNDIMRLYSLEPGPQIGQILNYLLEKVLDNPEDNTPEKLKVHSDVAVSGLKGQQ